MAAYSQIGLLKFAEAVKISSFLQAHKSFNSKKDETLHNKTSITKFTILLLHNLLGERDLDGLLRRSVKIVSPPSAYRSSEHLL